MWVLFCNFSKPFPLVRKIFEMANIFLKIERKFPSFQWNFLENSKWRKLCHTFLETWGKSFSYKTAFSWK
jgi:hypothetical protein